MELSEKGINGSLSLAQKCVIGMAFFTAANSIFFKMSSLPPMAFVSYRFLVATFIFCLASLFFVKKSRIRSQFNPKHYIMLFLAGCVFSVGAYVFFIALKTTSVSSVLILLSSTVIFMAVLSRIFLKEKNGLFEMLALLTAFSGCLIIALMKTGGVDSLYGNMCAMTCALCCAIYMVIMKYLSHIDMPVKLFITYLGSFCFSAVIAVKQGVLLGDYQLMEYLFPIGSALLSVCIPQSVINWGLKSVGVTFVGSITLMEPVIGSVYAYIIWREIPGSGQLIGGFLVLGGLFLYYRFVGRTKRAML